ncbi:MAG: STAS domain-containing protein [Planctomycetota bacterium]
MGHLSSSIELARSQNSVYIRIIGAGNMTMCPTLYDIAEQMLKEGFRKFIIDLKECTGMDSTFMGTLVEIAAMSPPISESLMVINPSPYNLNLLESLGLGSVIIIKQGKKKIPEVEVEVIHEVCAPPQRRIALTKRAHENLVRIDKRNEVKFGPFLKQLARELGE